MIVRKNIEMIVLLLGLIVSLGLLWETSIWMYAVTLGAICLLEYTVRKDLFVSASLGTVVVMLLVLIGSGIGGLTSLLVFGLTLVLFSKVRSYQTTEYS